MESHTRDLGMNSHSFLFFIFRLTFSKDSVTKDRHVLGLSVHNWKDTIFKWYPRSERPLDYVKRKDMDFLLQHWEQHKVYQRAVSMGVFNIEKVDPKERPDMKKNKT